MSAVRGRGAVAVAAVVAVYIAGARALAGHEVAGHVWADAWWTATSGLAAIACFTTARTIDAPHRRAAWRWFGLGAAAWFVGMLVWSFDELRGTLVPFPSIADALFEAIAPCFVVGCFRYGAGRPSTALTLKQIGDLGVISCVVVLLATLALYGELTTTSDDARYVLTAIAYPVLHWAAVIFGLVCWWQHLHGKPRWVVGLLLLAMALFALTATFYASSLLAHGYDAGWVLDPVWIAAFAIMIWAAREERQPGAAGDHDDRFTEAPTTDALVPTIAILSAVIGAIALRERFVGAVIEIAAATGIGLALMVGLRLAAGQHLEHALRVRIRADEAQARRLHAQLLHAQRLQAIGAMASGVAHDYNNLMQVMSAGLALARRRLDVGKAATAELDQVEAAMWRAADLGHRLLDLARQRPTRDEPVDVERMVTAVASLLERVMPPEVALEIDPVPADLPAIEIDPAALENALLNLGLNARDAMKGRTGAVRFAVTHEAQAGVGPAVVIRVDDDGPGIAPELREEVFRPFYRVEKSRNKKTGGVGLGLSIAQDIVHGHGGEIFLEDSNRGGLRVVIRLPL